MWYGSMNGLEKLQTIRQGKTESTQTKYTQEEIEGSGNTWGNS